MKKLLSLFVTAAATAGGLVALSSASSTAVDPYPGSIETKCIGRALGTATVSTPTSVRFRVGTAGNGPASGTTTWSYTRRHTGEVVASGMERRYQGPDGVTYTFHRIPRGQYIVRVRFDSEPADSVFMDCATSFRQRVYPATTP